MVLSIAALILSLVSIGWNIYSYYASNYSKITYELESVEGINYDGKNQHGNPIFTPYRKIWLVIRNLSRRPSAITEITAHRIVKTQEPLVQEVVPLEPWSIAKVKLEVSDKRPLPRYLVIQELDGKAYIAMDFIDPISEELILSKPRKYRDYDVMYAELQRKYDAEREAALEKTKPARK